MNPKQNRMTKPGEVPKVQEGMQEAARRHIRSTGDFRTPRDLTDAFGKDDRWLEQVKLWKHRREIFSIEDDGQELFPVYEFDPGQDHQPYAVVGEALRIFRNQRSDWAIAYWFEGLNSYLDGQRPKDLLNIDPERVVVIGLDIPEPS